MSFKAWIQAARLRTLPLAISTMIVGNSLAAVQGSFSWTIAIFSVLTAVSLQVLSNLANDYGDSVHGADSEGRIGPSRAVQKGLISHQQMRNGIKLFIIISLVFGVILILISFRSIVFQLLFFVLGLTAIWAAINYTSGNNPYGYSGKGDIAVFIFFGLVTVLGSYFLQTKGFEWTIMLPAIACGALSVGVLNINNIRDIHSDQKAGKMSVPVKIGREAAIRYHGILMCAGLMALVAYGIVNSFGWSYKWLFMVISPLLVYNFFIVMNTSSPEKLDPYLRQLALSSSLLFVLFAVCIVIF